MNIFKLKPDDVFTPRSARVNPRLYIARPDLESELREGLSESQHLVIFGESGNGKSWLYKRVFEKESVYCEVINLVQASRLGSLGAAFSDKLDRLETIEEQEYEVSKKGALAPGGVGFEAEGTWKYIKGKKEPFEALLTYMKSRGKRKKKVIVFDNFEQISTQDALCKEVSDCIILLDDPIYADYEVKICIVGVPSGIDEILAKHGNIQTISSRLKEIPEVSRMTKGEARSLMALGLERALGLEIRTDKDEFYSKVLWVTDGIALELQELGLRIAKEASHHKDIIDDRVVSVSIQKWAKNSIRAYCAAIVTRLNSRETKAARRNQCIYACGYCDAESFTYKAIEKIVREVFPDSTSGVQLNISGELSRLSKGDNPILKRLPSGDAYRLANPKYRMAIRTLLSVDPDGKVIKIASLD